MDTGSKTLAQLSEENKESKYVTLDTAAKISGYTKDYLERLCRLNKVEYRLWSNGSFVIELESLLRETQALLLSYEGINFVERSELTDPVPQMVGNILSSALKEASTVAIPPSAPSFQDSPAFKSGIAQPVPTFGGTIVDRTSPVSFVGRAVVSDALHPEEKIEKKTESKKIALSPATPLVAPPLPSSSEGEGATHVPIAKFNINAIRENASPPTPEKSVAEKVRERIPVVAVNSEGDDWDAQLLGTDVAKQETPRHIPVLQGTGSESTQPSVAVSEEPPPLSSISPAALSEVTPTPVVAENTTPPIQGFTPLSGQKVVVFSNNLSNKEKSPTPAIAAVKDSAGAVFAAASPVSIAATDPHISLALVPALPVLTSTPELKIPPSQNEFPATTVNALPIVNEEHHFTLHETHPLMKSAGFNVVFAALLIASSFIMLGGRVLENVGGKLNNAEYVAGVGALGGSLPASTGMNNDERAAVQKGERAMLPFSNEVIATSGNRTNSIIVRPVFESGPGKAYEYILIPEGDSTSTPRE